MNINKIFSASLVAASSIWAQYDFEPVAQTQPVNQQQDANGQPVYQQQPAQPVYQQQPAQPVYQQQPAQPVYQQQPAQPVYQQQPGQPVYVQPVAQPAPRPVVVVPPKPVIPMITNMDMLRGNAYGVIPNEAAATTVDGALDKPHNMADKNFLYLQPIEKQGVVAWGKGTTYFMGLDDADSLGLLSLGLAFRESFGLTFNLALGKTWAEEKEEKTVKTTTVEAGDLMGLAASTLIGGTHALAAKLDWETFDNEVSVSGTDKDKYNLQLDVNYGNGPSGTEDFWSLGANILRHENSTESDNTTTIGLDTRLEVTPYFNYGSKVLAHERARVFVGVNGRLPIQIFDAVDAKTTSRGYSHFATALILSPNLMGELAITKEWLVFGGASHDISVLAYSTATDKAPSNSGQADEKTTIIQMRSTLQTAATAGVRYQKERFALEAGLENEVYVKGPAALFNGNNLLASFSGFIYF